MNTITPLVHTPLSSGTRQAEEIELEMDNAYLESFLKALPGDCSPVSRSILMCNYDLSKRDFRTAKQLLLEKQLITEQRRHYLPPSFCLTPLGKSFLARGGFQYEQKGKESFLMANTLVRVAIILSVVAIILNLVLIGLLIYGE